MPIYEYRCKECNAQFDVLQRIGADAKDVTCPECGKPGPERMLSVFASSGSDSAVPTGACGSGSGFT